MSVNEAPVSAEKPRPVNSSLYCGEGQGEKNPAASFQASTT